MDNTYVPIGHNFKTLYGTKHREKGIPFPQLMI